MSSAALAWLLFEPLLAGTLAALLLVARRRWSRQAGPARWPGPAALAVASAGFLIEGMLAWLAAGTSTLAPLGLSLAISPVSRAGLLAANAVLLCALFLNWTEQDPNPRGTRSVWIIISASLVSCLLAGALLASERIVQVFALLGAAVAVLLALGSAGEPLEGHSDDELRSDLATALAGGLKQMSLATMGTGLLVVGALLLARYPFNLENRGLLQVGIGLLALGILVRAGIMPFAAASGDLTQSAPSTVLIALGAIAPTTLLAGLLMLGPVEGNLAGSASAAWLGAVGATLAGIRALRAAAQTKEGGDGRDRTSAWAALISMTFALQAGWALFGVLAASRSGATGAVLLAANMALAGVLLLLGRYSRIALVVGVISLLGLPPFGGFAGALLVAQAATNMSGVWLAVLLLGSLLTATAWLVAEVPGPEERGLPAGWLQVPVILVITLVAVQPGLFLAANALARDLSAWATTVPWLAGP